MKYFVFLVVILSFAYSFSFVNPHVIRHGFCDNECNQLTTNKAHQERKDFNRTYFNKCENVCINYQDYRNLK